MKRFTQATLAATAGLVAVLVSGGLGCRDEHKGDPQTYVGQTVTPSGEVERVIGTQGFRFDPDERFDQEVLVLTRGPVQLGAEGIEDGQKLRVTGTVRAFVVAEIERDLGWELDPEIEAEFSSKPVIIADTVALADDPSVSWSARPGVAPSPSEPRTTTPAATPPPGEGGATPDRPGGEGGGGGY
jgi:hypothetical protein